MSCSSDIEQQTSFNTKAKLKIKRELSIKGILTATTLRKAIIAIGIGKRYFWIHIGVVLMVADFYDCFYG